MSNKVRIIYKGAELITVLYPAPKSRRPEETEEQWLDRVFTKATPPGTDYDDVDISQIPTDRTNRDAWYGKKGEGIKINAEKAKKIREDKLIAEEMGKLLKEQAIKSLKDKGEI